MFQTVPLPIIRSFPLYAQQWYRSYRFADSLWAGSVPSWSQSQAVSKPVWHVPLLCVHWKTPDDGQRNCPKHVEVYSKNKFEKLVHLVGLIVRFYRVAQSPELQKCLCVVNALMDLPNRVDSGKFSSSGLYILTYLLHRAESFLRS